MFIDGVLDTSRNDFSKSNFDSSGLRVGSELWGNYFNGYIDELRISKGIARWTSNFTPPTDSYTPTGPANISKLFGKSADVLNKVGGIPIENIKSIMGVQ